LHITFNITYCTRMNISLNEKNSILESISYAIDNPEYELECLVNNSSTLFRPNIKHDNFISIIKRFKGRPDFEASENVRLAISFPESSKYNNVRVLIKGNGPINNYCNNENINLIRKNVDFEEKSNVRNKINNKKTGITIYNYGIKFNLKQEKNFNNDEARINELIRDWNTEMKDFRYKKTFAFQKKTKDFQIDVSIVKSSTLIDNRYISVKEVQDNNLIKYVIKPSDIKDYFQVWWKSIENKPDFKVKVKGSLNYYKTVKESAVFTNIPTYEAEIEYIKNKKFGKQKFKNITEKKDYIQGEYVNFFKQIGSVLQCVQGSIYIISKDEMMEIENKFIKVVENSITETILHNDIISVGSESDVEESKAIIKDKLKSKGNKKGKGDDKRIGNGKSKNIIKFKHKNYQTGGTNNTEKKIDSTSYTLDSDNEIHYNTDDDEDNDYTRKVLEDISTMEGGGSDNDDNDNDDNDDDIEDNQDNETNETNISKLNNISNTLELDQNQFHIQQEGGTRNIARIKYEITEKLLTNGIFFGPMIVDLSHNNSAPIDPEAIPDIKTNTNIHINYLVTDKTDGERYLLFFDEKGKLYGIDRKSVIKSYGTTIPALANSIFDGEHVTHSKDDKILNNFYIFDTYIYKGENIIIKNFNFSKTGRADGRHKYILEAEKIANDSNGINIQLNTKLPFRIFKKDYYPSNSPDTYSKLRKGDKPLISENCEFLLNKMNVKYGGNLEIGHLFTYKTDGLIFLPNNLSVYQKYEDDYDSIKNPFKTGTWYNNYKWKPIEHLTVDFKIEFLKDMSTNKLEYKYFDSNKKYLKVNLISSVRQSKDQNSIINNKLNFYLLNSGLNIQSIPEDFKFFSTNPFIGSYDNEGNLENNMGEAYFEVDENDNIVCKNGNFITNGIICECSYNKNIKNLSMCWQPERVRADKTLPNAYNTAVTAWELINNPITKEKLSATKTHFNTEEIQDTNLESVAYYNSNTKTEYLTTPFKELANFVKRYIIDRGLTGYVKPKVLDLAVGKLGELDKYTRAGVHTLVGIDINEDSINNPENGAATRIIKNANYAPAIAKLSEKTILIVGTATKNIENGESVRDNINKYYIDVLYGRAKGNTPKLRKMEGVGLDKFDMVSCMYAIHYMMNNESELENFLINVSENLLDQGYFIGTCLNGDVVLNEMGNKSELKGVIDGKTVFLIKKTSDDPKDYKNITVGNKINVFFETFGGAFNENLVSIPYLRQQAKKHNLKLIDYKSFLEEPGNLLSMYEASTDKWIKNAKNNAQTIRNSNAMTTWTKMNCYFIFQKVRKVD